MLEGRAEHTATVLPSGLVLVSGGTSMKPLFEMGREWDSLASAELYDPALGAWTDAGVMQNPRARHRAFLIRTGPHADEVLVVGGCSGFGYTSAADTYFHCRPLRTTEFYDPTTGQWQPGPELPHAPGSWNVIQLADGKLLAAGTLDDPNAPPGPESQLLDLAANEPAWQLVAPMNHPRVHQSMVLLEDGEVLAVGGIDNWGHDIITSTAERYDPVDGGWSMAAEPPLKRYREVLIGLPGGNVLRAGACGNSNWYCESEGFPPPTGQAWIYDPTKKPSDGGAGLGEWRETTPMYAPHIWPSSLRLDSGKVLVAGGTWKKISDAGTDYYPSPTPEVFDPSTETWSQTGLMPHYVQAAGAMVQLPSGAVLFTGGYVNGHGDLEFIAASSAQVYR